MGLRGPGGVRVASWHRGVRKVPARGPWRAWEPVVYRGARHVDDAGVSDAFEYFARPRLSDPGRVVGAKPAAFCFWVFKLLGATPGDALNDLYPGSGGVARAWQHYVSAVDERHVV